MPSRRTRRGWSVSRRILRVRGQAAHHRSHGAVASFAPAATGPACRPRLQLPDLRDRPARRGVDQDRADPWRGGSGRRWLGGWLGEMLSGPFLSQAPCSSARQLRPRLGAPQLAMRIAACQPESPASPKAAAVMSKDCSNRLMLARGVVNSELFQACLTRCQSSS
jgi:hypothetical protein